MDKNFKINNKNISKFPLFESTYPIQFARFISEFKKTTTTKTFNNRRTSILGSLVMVSMSFRAQTANSENVSRCLECTGTGIIPCDMCNGTGIWKTIGRKRSRNRYEFVECPQCFGKGVKVCGICFGTGQRNVRGLLRRPETNLLIDKMQYGKINPGEVQNLLSTAREDS